MTRKRDRAFAAMGAMLFLLSTAAVTGVVIWEIATQGKQSSATSPTTTTQCQDNQTETALAPPEVFKPSGDVTKLEVTDLEPGSGKTAKNGDCLVVKYYGTLATDGTVFDESFSGTSGFAFTLGQSQVISGWDQGLVGMKVGGTRRLVIPSDLAYGPSGSGSIPANADLVFVVKLLRIQ